MAGLIIATLPVLRRFLLLRGLFSAYLLKIKPRFSRLIILLRRVSLIMSGTHSPTLIIFEVPGPRVRLYSGQ